MLFADDVGCGGLGRAWSYSVGGWRGGSLSSANRGICVRHAPGWGQKEKWEDAVVKRQGADGAEPDQRYPHLDLRRRF